jgi:membrane associated rhomboid family serine protease
MMPLTPWVKRLLLANVVMFLITMANPVLYRALILYPPWALLRPWTLVTYMFLHGGFGIFLWLYFVSGLGAALLHFFFAFQYPVVGASGAVYGILLGFALYWPRERIYLWMILPVEAWLLATLLVAGSLWAGVSGSASRTAHFAHLGGLAFAFVFLKWWEWRRGADRREWQRKMAPKPSGLSDRSAVTRWKKIPLEGLHEINREEVERLQAKVGTQGARGLTQAEREFLDRMSGG